MNGSQPTIRLLAESQASLLCRMAKGGDIELLRRMITELGEARDDGHVCIDLAQWCQESRGSDQAQRPDLITLEQQLLATGVVGSHAQADELRPLVLDDQHRLYTLRHHRAEQQIATFVRERIQREPTTTPAQLNETLSALNMLSGVDSGEIDWQLAAIVAGAACSLTVISGGPGTGKTTTVAKLLCVLLHDDPTLRIAIAAPTGKAASRLSEAIRERSAQTPQLGDSFDKLNPRTLHRLLGYTPPDDAFRFGLDNKLSYDVVVVDEASMVDPAVFAALCAAVPAATRLILVGDKDQLAAIAAGQVLGDLCHAAQPELGVGEQLATFVNEATGMQIEPHKDAAPMANATVTLTKNYRFGQQPGIGAFAKALVQRRPDDAMAAFDDGHADLSWTDNMESALLSIEPHLLRMIEAAAENTPERALDAISHARILTAQRHGPTGASTWNARIEQRLAEIGHRTDVPYYLGCPILITSNDPSNRVWNGDLGVCGRNAQGNPIVWVRDTNGDIRELTPLRLPAHETAWAMTVHKAQGSEFEHVLLALADSKGPLNHASLIYTGVTRAKCHATVCASRDLLTDGLGHWPQRHSGLAEALRN